MKPLINNQNHYNQTREYFIDYINHLFNQKPHNQQRIPNRNPT